MPFITKKGDSVTLSCIKCHARTVVSSKIYQCTPEGKEICKCPQCGQSITW